MLASVLILAGQADTVAKGTGLLAVLQCRPGIALYSIGPWYQSILEANKEIV